MKIIKAIQGSTEWHQHRATHLNASDAPAMMGVSRYKSRAQLLRDVITGVAAEVDTATQRRFDEGHRIEALARAKAEESLGEDLFPVIGAITVDGLALSASFDGMTMDGTTLWEHKTMNNTLREAFRTGDLPEEYRIQMEQQLMVSGAEVVRFEASKWDGDSCVESQSIEYRSDAKLRARIIAGWKQFCADAETGVIPEPEAPAPVGVSMETMPALLVSVKGSVLASNLDTWKASAMDLISGINRDLKTDQDFATAEKTVKWLKESEEKLSAAKANALAQMTDVDTLLRTVDDVSAEMRSVRLELDKLVKSEKDARKLELVRAGVDAVREHFAGLQLPDEYRPGVPADLSAVIGGAIRGLKSIDSMKDKISTAVANMKIDANADADRRRACIAVLNQAAQHRALIPDAAALVASKAPDDLHNLIAARVAEHEAKERARIEAERDRIRAEERAKAQAEATPPRAAETKGNVTPPVPAATVAAPATTGTVRAEQTGVVAHQQPDAEAIAKAVSARYGVDYTTAWDWCVDAFAEVTA